MDLRRHLLDLVAPTGIGDVLGPGARLVDASSELGLELRFELDGRTVRVELEPRDDRRPHAACSERLMISYRGGPLSAPVDPRRGQALCRAVAERVAANEDAVLAALARDAEGGEDRVREVEVERLLEPLEAGGRPRWGLSPYVGCTIGCRFCYAQSRLHPLRALLGRPDAPWGSWVDVRVNAPEVLASELERLPWRPIKLCPIVSDPYQPLERRHRLTRRCLEVLAASSSPPPVLVLTRADLVLEDRERLQALPRVWVGVSLPTVDDAVRRHFEPRAMPVARRLEVLASLRAAGIGTMAVVQPLLPGSIEDLADALAARVDSVSVGVLRGLEAAGDDFADPRFAVAATDAWQAERAAALREALAARGVPVWSGDLPPELEDAP